MKDENFLSRWSRKKTASKAGLDQPTADAVPAQAGTQSPPANVTRSEDGAQSPQPLPPVESLTPESDFTPFMQAGVDPNVKRDALKKLLSDPRHNVMDGLDVYIDDYSKPDPLPEGWLEKMESVKRLGIFKEPEETPAGEPAAAAEPLQKPMEEQALVPPAANAPSDTSSVPNPPSEVGKGAGAGS